MKLRPFLINLRKTYPNLGEYGFNNPNDNQCHISDCDFIRYECAFKKLTRFLSAFPKNKKINKNFTSYGLKACLEKRYDCYIPNGYMIAAMIYVGLEIGDPNPYGYSPNAYCNIRLPSTMYLKLKQTPQIDISELILRQ